MLKKTLFPEFGVMYRHYYKKHQRFYFTLIAFIVLCSMTPLLDTYLNVRLIDDVLPQKDMSAVFRLLIVFCLIYLFNITAAFVIQVAVTKKNNEIVEEMKLSAAYGMHTSFINEELEERSQITVVVTTDIVNIVTFMSSSMLSLVMHFSIITAFMVYLVQYSPVLALITFLFSLLQALVVPFFASTLKRTSEGFRHNSEDEVGYINSITANMKMISLFGLINESIEKYRNIIGNFKDISLRNLIAGASQDFVVSLLSLVGNLLTIGLGAYWIIGEKLTLGVFVAFLSLSGIIKNSFAAIISFNSSYQSFRVSVDRYMSVLSAYPYKPFTGKELSSIDDIEFTGCEISVNDNVVSSNLNCFIKKGSKNLIIGANGCGKTSMLNVLCGFIPVKRGTLFVSGSDINDLNMEFLRTRISCCFQEKFFLQDTVLANICPQKDYAYDSEHFNQVVDFLGIDRKRLNEKLDISASEFSGGELQRICLARTLMKNSDVYLFDEPFSNIEEKGKAKIFRCICDFLSDKTVIFISHDSEVYEEAQRLAVNRYLFDDMTHC